MTDQSMKSAMTSRQNTRSSRKASPANPRGAGRVRKRATRALLRNSGKRGYQHKQAHNDASERRKKASSVPRKISFAHIELIEKLLTGQQWSPDQISGWLARSKVFVSHEWIYRHIWANKKKRGNLWTHLRHRGKKHGSVSIDCWFF